VKKLEFGEFFMPKKKTRRKKVSFMATEKVPKRVPVSFRTTKGEKVSFRATKKVPKRVKVEFFAKRKKRR
jgi:hypothetical protein